MVVRDLPNLNLSLNEKVRFYMALVQGQSNETTAQEQRTRPNVENEIGMLQTAENIGARIMKESGVSFASNYAEKVWIGFTKEHVPDAFIDIAKELRAFGFIA